MAVELRKAIKALVPRSLVLKTRMGREYPKFRKLACRIERGEYCAACFLIGTPVRRNLGDHLIALAALDYLGQLGLGCNVVEVPMEMYRLYASKLESGIDKNALILVSGGGWMGDVWPEDELTVQDVVRRFPDNRIVVLPQTVYYDWQDESLSNQLIESGMELYRGHERLAICVRDRRSKITMNELFPATDVKLVPDMALSYMGKSPKHHRMGASAENLSVGFCLRGDRERVRSSDSVDTIKRILSDCGCSFGVVDTIAERAVSAKCREEVVIGRLRDFAKFDLIITDRLHGMLFSFLADTPCIVMDNKTKKVSGVYDEWLSSSSRILACFDGVAEEEVLRFLGESRLSAPNDFSLSRFEFLEDVIKNG